MSKVDVSEAVEQIARRFNMSVGCCCDSIANKTKCLGCSFKDALTNLITTERARIREAVEELNNEAHKRGGKAAQMWEVDETIGIKKACNTILAIIDSKPTKG